MKPLPVPCTLSVIVPVYNEAATARPALEALLAKEIPGVRTYAAVDGGMGDNVCPALYGEKMEAVLANRMRARDAGEVTISGKFCESGDILIRDIVMPKMSAGDILAIAVNGAYSIPESMNYNAFYKPPVIMVKDGKAKLIRRRETLADITRCDVM